MVQQQAINYTSSGPIIPGDSVWTFVARIAGCSVDAGEVSSAIIKGSIKRIGNTTTVCTIDPTDVIHADDADVVFTATANDTNDSLEITVTDMSDDAVAYRFSITIDVEQITFT